MRIFEARDRDIHGGRGGLGMSLEGIQECIISRKRDLKEDQEASMLEDRRESQGVDRRRLFIVGRSALL